MSDSRLTLVGHPLVPIGRGEDLRSVFRALQRSGLDARIVDLYGAGTSRDPELVAELGPHIEDGACGRLNIFVLNGDEVEKAREHLGRRLAPEAYNVVAPVWELSRYPASWAAQLDRFDEIWVPSAFVRDAIAPAVRRPVMLIPWANGARLTHGLGRRQLGIRESSYVFLFAFDLRSFVGRKNPLAVLEAFEGLVDARPQRDVSLVMKIGGGGDPVRGTGEVAAEIRRRAADCPAPVVVIDRDILDQEMKSLLVASDAIVSLHRSEGFGRLMAEAMLLGKPVIATAYSGNLEFMREDNALLVPYRLIDVRKNEYPHARGQVWADADVAEATRHMIGLVDDPDAGRRLGERASRHIRVHFSHRAVGLRYRKRIEEILSGSPLAAPRPAGAPGERTAEA